MGNPKWPPPGIKEEDIEIVNVVVITLGVVFMLFWLLKEANIL